MASYNKVILLGNLVKDVELKTLQSGSVVGSSTLAVNNKYTTKSGEKKEEVSFIDIDLFGKTAETVAQYVKKGSPLLVDGRLKQEFWEKDGKKMGKLKVVVDSFQFVGSSKKEESGGDDVAY
jgi:single-strand DNA-binding protein